MSFACPTITKAVQGKKYTLRMDFNAVVLAEQLSGVKLLDPDAWLGMSTGVVTSVFFAAALQTDSSLKLAEFRKLKFDDKTKAAIVDGVREAWRAVNDIPPALDRPTDGSASSQADGEA